MACECGNRKMGFFEDGSYGCPKCGKRHDYLMEPPVYDDKDGILHVFLPNVCPYCSQKRLHLVLWERDEKGRAIFKCPNCGKESYREVSSGEWDVL